MDENENKMANQEEKNNGLCGVEGGRIREYSSPPAYRIPLRDPVDSV